MPKKIICLILIISFLFTFVGCNGMNTEKSMDKNSMFVEVESKFHHGNPYSVVYHKDTKVMYAIDYQNHFTVMVDAEGKPLLYEEDSY